MMGDAPIKPIGAVSFDSDLSDSKIRGRVSRDVSTDTVDGREW
jgi:hypothetical protein